MKNGCVNVLAAKLHDPFPKWEQRTTAICLQFSLFISKLNEDILEKSDVQVSNLIDLNDRGSNSLVADNLKNETDNKNTISSNKETSDWKNTQIIMESNTVQMLKTSCGDAHNIGLDVNGKAYSLPSPLDFNPFPNGSTHKVK